MTNPFDCLQNSFCVHCKNVTPSSPDSLLISLTSNDKFLGKGVCVNCNKIKTKFVKGEGLSRLKGNERKTMEYYANFANDAYEPVNDRHTIDGYEYMPSLSDHQVAVYKNPSGKVIVAYKGTSDKGDIIPDVKIALNKYKNSGEYKNKDTHLKSLIKDYGADNIITTGHSKGAFESHHLAVTNGLKSHSFAVGGTPLDITKKIFQQGYCKIYPSKCKDVLENNYTYTTGIDPVSFTSMIGIGNNKLVKLKTKNVHGLKNYMADKEDVEEAVEEEPSTEAVEE